MTVLPLVIAPDPFLNEASEKVEVFDDETRMLLNDMLETMYASHGIGLAAVQVGFHQRLIVVDIDWRDGELGSRNPLKLVNAEIVESSPTQSSYNEGCLSFPGQYSEVIRPETITIRYQDEFGNENTLEADGLLATCIQHEIDHTKGITFVDHISRLKRDRILKKLDKAKKQGAFDHTEGKCGDPHCDHEH